MNKPHHRRKSAYHVAPVGAGSGDERPDQSARGAYENADECGSETDQTEAAMERSRTCYFRHPCEEDDEHAIGGAPTDLLV